MSADKDKAAAGDAAAAGAADHLGWTKNEITKDLIDPKDYPKKKLSVKWDTAVADCCGVLEAWQVFKEPKLAWNVEDEEKDNYYTVIMTDPDAPSRKDPSFGPWLHWIVINVQNNDVSKGQVIAPYIGCGAPEKTGLHRYTLMVCKQNKGEMCDYKGKTWTYSGKDRNNQDFKKFKEDHDLTILAGNCFMAEYDASVPKLYEQLGKGVREELVITKEMKKSE